MSEAPLTLLFSGVDVAPLAHELAQNPQLWDQNRFRTQGGYGNPHAKLSDIIVRANDWANWTKDRAAFNDVHESVWWEAFEHLPSINNLVFDLMRLFQAEQLGMVLITRIPPTTDCARHRDVGWHAGFYTKFALQVKASPGQRFCFDNLEVETQTGDLYSFDNSIDHWVTNPTAEERITLIMCLRLKQPTCTPCAWTGDP